MFKGKLVTALKAGRYTALSPRSERQGRLHHPGDPEGRHDRERVSFIGKRTISIEMTAGQWFFYPTFVGAKSYFIVTS